MNDGRKPKRHPIQPLEQDANGDLRFRPNAIVRHLFNAGKLDLAELRRLDFSEADWEQLTQQLGYTISRAPVSEQLRQAAERMYNEGLSELESRYQSVCDTLETTRAELAALRNESAGIFGAQNYVAYHLYRWACAKDGVQPALWSAIQERQQWTDAAREVIEEWEAIDRERSVTRLTTARSVDNGESS